MFQRMGVIQILAVRTYLVYQIQGQGIIVDFSFLHKSFKPAYNFIADGQLGQ